jgi:hypothetical protein
MNRIKVDEIPFDYLQNKGVASAGRNKSSSNETIDLEGEDVLNMVELEVKQRREMLKTMTDEIEMNLERGARIDTDTVKQGSKMEKNAIEESKGKKRRLTHVDSWTGCTEDVLVTEHTVGVSQTQKSTSNTESEIQKEDGDTFQSERKCKKDKRIKREVTSFESWDKDGRP